MQIIRIPAKSTDSDDDLAVRLDDTCSFSGQDPVQLVGGLAVCSNLDCEFMPFIASQSREGL